MLLDSRIDARTTRFDSLLREVRQRASDGDHRAARLYAAVGSRRVAAIDDRGQYVGRRSEWRAIVAKDARGERSVTRCAPGRKMTRI